MSDLRITARVESQNARHTRITVFQNGGNAGTLVVDTDQAADIMDFLDSGRFKRVLFAAVCSCGKKVHCSVEGPSSIHCGSEDTVLLDEPTDLLTAARALVEGARNQDGTLSRTVRTSHIHDLDQLLKDLGR